MYTFVLSAVVSVWIFTAPSVDGVQLNITYSGTNEVDSTTYSLKCEIPTFNSQAAWSRGVTAMSTCFNSGCLTPSVPPYTFRNDPSAIYVDFSRLAASENGIQWTCEHIGDTAGTFIVVIESSTSETTTDGLSDGAKAGIAVACVTVIVIIVIIICCRKPRGDPQPVPKVIVSILYYEIPKGYIVTLLVVVESDTTVNEISWQKKVENEFIPIYLQPLKYKGSTPNEPSLTILDVCPDDSGVYQCSATNRYGTGQSTNTATVSVAANAQAYTTTVGSSVELLQSLCETQNVTSVKWTHDRAQNLIFEDVDDLMYKGGNFKHPSLTIPWVSLEDVGTWRCFLETETLRRVIDAQLNIKEKHMEEKVGSKVVLFLELCEINGIEKVEWRHNNQAPDEHSNSLVNRRPSYTIEDAVCENSGTWLCILQLRNSPKSKKTYRVQLKVKDKGNSSLPPIKGVTNN